MIRWLWRRRPSGDEGSLPLALMVSTVAVVSTGLIVSMVVNQSDTSRLTTQRLSALQAAQSGLDTATAAIRSSGGSKLLLPCATSGAPLTGSVGADGSSARFRVVIQYFSADPTGRTDSWRESNKMLCSPGLGVALTPAYAGLISTGTDQPTGSFSSVPTRELRGIYTFSTTNQNISGGLIHIWRSATPGTTPDLCLDAGSAAPIAGTVITTQRCDATDLGQKWAYNTNLSLSLTPSATGGSLGMCLQAGTGSVGAVAAVQPCSATTSYTQQWSYNTSSNLEGTSDGRTLNGICLRAQTADTIGSTLVLATGCGGGASRTYTFSPDAAVGAGMAGAGTGQLVNYAQFGRCLDVTYNDENYPHLISWPCKQVPDPSAIDWNQKWALPVLPAPAKGPKATAGPIKVKSTYCLQSPGGTALGQYVVTRPCVALQANQQWTVMNATTDYATSYTLIDYQGNCLTPRDPSGPDPDLFQVVNTVSKIYVAPCDASLLQKWNAPANLIAARRLKEVTER